MARKPSTTRKLTPGEMEIMSLLWQHGELSLSEAHQAATRPIGYTTMQTRLNRLVEKKLVNRSKDRPAIYTAAISREDVSTNQLNVLLERVTQGQIVPLVANLVNDRSLSADEISELRSLVDQAERRLKEEEK